MTSGEFTKYLGPYFRNKVQNKTRKYKNQIGYCEHCGVKNVTFDFAHKKGFGRKQIIDNLFDKYGAGNLKKIEEEFDHLHNNLKSLGLVLCKKCHIEYDKKAVDT
jgi:hypothetical protein